LQHRPVKRAPPAPEVKLERLKVPLAMPRSPDPTLAARRRAQILEAAMVCFRRRGFHQATMQEICAEARVSPGALYRYFDSKADIIVAIAQEEHAGLEPFLARLETGGDFTAGLLEIAHLAWTKFHSAEDASLIGDVLAEAGRDRVLAEHIIATDAALRQRLAAAIATAQKRGEIDARLDPVQVARTALAIMDGIGIRLSLTRSPDLAQASADFAFLIGRAFAPASKAQTKAKAPSRAKLKPKATAKPSTPPRRATARVKEKA
jgi:TetR/AcrR family transcriptional regulator, repressor for uid operon